jgi:hypothetical protein
VSLFNRKQGVDSEGQQTDNPGKSKVSILILLILAGGFGYLYFFTSLIVPHEGPPPPPVAVPEVKKSMPPKPGDQPVAPAPVAADATRAAAAKPAVPTAPAPKPAAAPAPPAAPVAAVAKPAPAPAPAAAKPAPAPAKKDAAPAVKKVETPVAKPAPSAPKKEEPKAAAKPASPVAEKQVAKKKTDSYTIAVGEFSAGEEAGAIEARLAKLNIKPVKKTAMKKNRKMTRLFSGTYADYDAYSVALEKLKKSANGVFAIEKDGKYSLYAGSFSSAKGAEKEKRLLQTKGVSVQLQPVLLLMSYVKISAGHFAAKSDAAKSASRLRAEGIAVKVIPVGK